MKGAAELIIAKHRNGSTGRIQLRFIGESTKFVDVDAQGEPNEEPQYGRRSQENEDDYGDDNPATDAFPPPDEGLPFD